MYPISLLNLLGSTDQYYDSTYGFCIKCEEVLFGCNSCSESWVNSQQFIVCAACTDGLYLLANQTTTSNYPSTYSHCVPDCTLAHSSYVNNDINRQCSWCGEHCSSCNQKHGCENCQAATQNAAHVNGIATISNVYSNFKMCRKCSNDIHCRACNPSNVGECWDCDYPANQFVAQYGSSAECTLQTAQIQGYDANCYIYDYYDGVNCAQCQDGYYLNAFKYWRTDLNRYQTGCDACKIAALIRNVDFQTGTCLSAYGYFSCSACQYGYARETYNGLEPCLCLFPEAVRCDILVDASGSFYNHLSTIGCRDGYVNSNTGQCTSSCPTGSYGVALYNSRGVMETSQCLVCSSNCYECTENAKCKSCKKGFYLQTSSSSVTTGTCVSKSASSITADVWVTTPASPNPAFSSADGSYGSPMNSIQEAIARAYEIGAPYSSAVISIYLLPGTHFMSRQYPTDFYMPQKYDQNSQTTKIILDAFDSQTEMVVNYKLRDSFKFHVGAGLSINNIRFNAIDSSLDLVTDIANGFNYARRTNGNQCSFSNGALTGGGSCSLRTTPSDDCVIAHGTSFIKFDIHPETMLTQPPTLELYSTKFWNFNYEWNSFIELNDYGGHIYASYSEIDTLNSCGSFIRNRRYNEYQKTVDYSSYASTYKTRNNNYAKEVYSKIYSYPGAFDPFSASCSRADGATTPCFSIIITESEFYAFGFMKSYKVSPTWVDPAYKLKHSGLIIDLDNFLGPIEFTRTQVVNNYLRHSSCQAGFQYKNNIYPGDNYPSYGTKSSIQVKSLISIVNHGNFPVEILRNDFHYNVGTKGIIYLDMKPRTTTSRVIIGHNYFLENGGYFDNSVIYIRARGSSTQNVYSDIPTASNLFCTGYHFERNTFTRNYGCAHQAGGIIKLECVNDGELDDYPNGLIDHPNLDSTAAAGYYNIDKTTYTTSIVTHNFYGYTYSIDMNINTFRYNTYTKNFATNDHGLLTIIGSPRTIFEYETFDQNGDASWESTNKVGYNFYINPDYNYETYGASIQYYDTFNQDQLANSLIKIDRSTQVIIMSCKFNKNWMYEPSYSTKRAQIATFQNFYGQFTLDKLDLQNQWGAYQTALDEIQVDKSYFSFIQSYASPMPMFRFIAATSKVKFVDCFKVGPSIIKENTFYQHPNNPDSPLFFDIKISGDEYQADIFYFNNVNFVKQDSYYATIAPFVVRAKQVQITNSQFTQFGYYGAYNIGLYSYAPIFSFKMRKPYTNSASTLITETVNFNNLTLYDCYGGNGAKFAEFIYESTANEQEPTSSQIVLENSKFDTFYAGSNGVFAFVDINSMQMTMNNMTFKSMVPNYWSLAFGGVLYASSMGKLTLNKVYAEDIFAGQSTPSNGGGRFLFLYQSIAFQLVITSSTFIGDASPDFSTAQLKTRVNNQVYGMGSMFHMETSSSQLIVSVEYSSFSLIETAYMSAAVHLSTTSSTKELSIKHSSFKDLTAVFGSVTYCQACTVTLVNNTHLRGIARYGGDYYMEDSLNDVVFDSQVSDTSYASKDGASIYFYDYYPVPRTITINAATSTSSYFNLQALGNGGAFYFYCQDYLKIKIEDTKFDYIRAGLSGAAFFIDEGVSADFEMDLNNSTINKIHALGGSGGFISVPSTSVGNFISVQDTTFTDLDSTSNGGSFHLQGTGDVSLSFQNTTLDQSFSAQSGGFIYASGTNPQLTTSGDSTYLDSKAAISGGFAYFGGLGDAEFIISDSSISTCQANGGNGGIIRTGAITSSSLIITNSIISYSLAQNGGIIYSQSADETVDITNTTINYSQSSQEGGAFYLGGSSSQTVTIDGESTLKNIRATGNGGLFYLNGASQAIDLQSSSMINITSNNQGGVFYSSTLTTTLSIILADIQANRIFSTSFGSFIKVQGDNSPLITMSITDSLIDCRNQSLWSSWPSVYNTVISNLDSTNFSIGNVFNFEDGSVASITSSSNIFKHCFTTSQGSIFYLPTGSSLTDTASVFQQNAGIKGQIYCDACTLSMTQTEFSDQVARDASIVYIKDNSTIVFDQVKMSHGKARQEGGAILAEGSGVASITFSNCPSTISYFQSGSNGGFMKIDNPDLTFTSTDCNWNHLNALGDGGFVDGLQMKAFSIGQCQLINVTSQSQGSLISSTTPDFTFSISQCTFGCLSTYNASSVSSSIIAQSSTIGSLFYIQNAVLVNSNTNTFQNCYTSEKGAIFNLKNSTFNDQSSIYNQIAALQGGAIYMDTVSSTFLNTQFSNINAYSGGVFYAIGQCSLSFNNLIVNNSTSRQDGGFIWAEDSALSQSISFLGTTSLTNISSTLGNGGSIYINSPLGSLVLDGTSAIVSSTANIKGGVIYALKASQILISSTTISNAQSISSGSILYSEAQGSVSILQSSVNCKSSAFSSNEPQMSAQTSSIGGAFYIKDSSGVISTSNTISNCYLADVGGAYYLENTGLTDTGGSIFTGNAAVRGGAFNCKNCSISTQNSIFTKHQAYQGGLMYLSERSMITLDNIQIQDSYASLNGGLVYSITTSTPSESQIQFMNTAMITNISSQNNGGSFYLSNKVMDIYMNTPITFTQGSSISGSGGVFYVLQARNIQISGSTFEDFQSLNSGSFLYSVSETLDLEVTGSTFDSQGTQWTAPSPDMSVKTQGGSFYVEDAVNQVLSTNNIFENNYIADMGGAFTIINGSLSDTGSVYQYNRARHGGAIYCDTCQLTLNSLTFTYNQAQFGGVFQIRNHQGVLSATNLTISNSKASSQGGVFFINGTSTSQMNLNDFTITSSQADGFGGTLFLNNPTQSITFNNLILDQSSSSFSSGGGFYIQNGASITLEDSALTNISAVTQGALLFSSGTSVNLQILNTTLLCKAQAMDYATHLAGKIDDPEPISDSAGAIYVTSALSVVTANNTMKNCYLADQGGVYSLVLTMFTDTNSTYDKHAALKGGLFYIERSTFNIAGATISNIYGVQGAVFYVHRSCPFIASTLTVDNALAINQGGMAYHTQTASPIGTYTVRYSDTSLTNVSSGVSGGAFYIDTIQVTAFTLHQVDFNNVTTKETGGVFQINRMNGPLTISADSQNTFSVFSAEDQGSFLTSSVAGFSMDISDSLFECKTSFDSASIEVDLLLSDTNFAGAFQLSSSTNGVTSDNNIFRNCYTASSGGFFTLIRTKFTDTTSNFYDNAAQSGGVFKCDSCTMTMNGSTFNNNRAGDGGVFLFDNQAALTANNVRFEFSSAIEKGGLMSIVKSSLTTLDFTEIKISNSLYISNTYAKIGALINLENKFISVHLYKTRITDIAASVQGGIFSVVDVNDISVSSSYFQDYSAPAGSFIYSLSSNLNLTLADTKFHCNTSLATADVQAHLDSTDPSYMYESTFYISKAVGVTSSKNTYKQCGTTAQGGVFTLSQTSFSDYYSTFSECSATSGGVISCQDCDMSLEKSSFRNNRATVGGVVSIQQDSYANIKNVKFEENQAYTSAGVIYVSTESYFDAQNCEFTKNQADKTSTIEVLGSSSVNNITITGSSFEGNTANKNTMSIMYANAIIKSSEFIDNVAIYRTKGIFCGFSNIIVERCQFKQESVNNPTSKVKQELTMGTYFFIIFDVILSITNSNFQNGMASLGGAIYISGDSDVSIYDSNFYKNYAKTFGGAIYGSGFSKLYIGKGSTFQNNIALEKGDDFYVLNTETNLIIEDTNITNPEAKTSIYAEVVSLSILRTNFLNMNKNDESLQGAAVTCINCRKINITSSRFRNIKSQLGGAIYIEENENNKKSADKYGKYIIDRTTFENCKANTGGAIYASNPQFLTINASTFRNNSVSYNKNSASLDISGAGGSIYYTCNSINLKCRVDLQNRNQFTDNYAQIKGGAIYWDMLEPVFKFNTDVIFSDNKAHQYADDIGCFAQTLAIINATQYKEKMIKLGLIDVNGTARRMLQGSSIATQIADQRSGGDIPPTYVAHIDKYGQIIGSDFKSKIRVLVNATSNTNTQALVYPPIIEGTTSFDSQGGMVEVKGLIFAGTPGFNYSIIFTTDGIDLTKVSNKQFMTSQSKSNLDMDLSISLRECEIGEQFTTAGKCIQCPDGTSYSLEYMKEPGNCATCPTEKAVCYGGSNVGPKAGYWRKNNHTSTFIKCLYQPACIGMVPPQNNPIGTCFEGYKGILCADCDIGFSRTGDFQCSRCPEPATNVVRLIFIFIAVIILLIFMVRSTLSGAHEKNNVTSIFTKILLNHVQLILLTASFDFDWPQLVIEFFDAAKPVASVSTQILSFDCFLDTRSANATAEEEKNLSLGIEIRIFFQKLIMLALLPLLLAALCFFVWNLIKRCVRGPLNVTSRAMSTLVIILFLVHPSIVQFMFYNFKCIDIDGEDRVQDDLEVICWNQEHTLFSYFIAVPSIIVWGLGIPFFALILLSRVRKDLEQVATREKYGFLYRGYRKDFYYWEIIIMYRKILLIFISVFISSLGVIAQALVVFMVLICFLIVNSKKKPFSTIALNDLETLSLVTSMITVYCGLFFISDKPEEWIKNNPDYSNSAIHLDNDTKLFFFAVIVFVNLIFFTYWSYKMYQEIKAKFRSKLPKIYLAMCLCFNSRKLQFEIVSHELYLENEGFREEYFKKLHNLKQLYRDGKLVLTQNSIERVVKYLDERNVIEVSGVTEKPDVFEQQKAQKRFNRIRYGLANQIVTDNGQGKGMVKIQPQYKKDMDDVNIMGNLNDNYYNYENLGKQANVKMIIPEPSNYLKIDEAFLSEFNPSSSTHSRQNSKSMLFNQENAEKVRIKSANQYQKHINQSYNKAPSSNSLKSRQNNAQSNNQFKTTLSLNDEMLQELEKEYIEDESIGFSDKKFEEDNESNAIVQQIEKKRQNLNMDLGHSINQIKKKMNKGKYEKHKQELKKMETIRQHHPGVEKLKEESLFRQDSIDREIEISDFEGSEGENSQKMNSNRSQKQLLNSSARGVQQKRKTLRDLARIEVQKEIHSQLGIVVELMDENSPVAIKKRQKENSFTKFDPQQINPNNKHDITIKEEDSSEMSYEEAKVHPTGANGPKSQSFVSAISNIFSPQKTQSNISQSPSKRPVKVQQEVLGTDENFIMQSSPDSFRTLQSEMDNPNDEE